MKRYILLFAGFILFSHAWGDVTCYKSGRTLFAGFTCKNGDSITIEQFRNDYDTMVKMATDKKCKTLVVMDAQDQVFTIINMSVSPQDCFGRLETAIHSYDEIIILSPEEVKVEEIQHHEKAKYKSDTYINGKLDNTYESDWDMGPFEKKQSTLTYVDGDVYTTVSYYVPPRDWTEKKERRIPARTAKVTNMTKATERFYKQTNDKN